MENRINNNVPELAVGVCYPNAIITQGIADVLEKNHFKVAFRVARVSEIYESCSQSTPEVIMVSTGSEGFCLDAICYMSSRATVIIMVSNNMPEISVEEALKAGAGGIVSTDEQVPNFIEGIQGAIKGNFSVSRQWARAVADKRPVQKLSPLPTNLTSREAEVLELIGKGMTNREIGEELYISTYTVKAHMRNITSKLNLKNRQQVSAYASKQGLFREVISGEPGEPGEPDEPLE